MPNFGGHDSQGSTAFKILGDGPVPTPREVVEKLDEYVIGQKIAKRVRSVCLLLLACMLKISQSLLCQPAVYLC